MNPNPPNGAWQMVWDQNGQASLWNSQTGQIVAVQGNGSAPLATSQQGQSSVASIKPNTNHLSSVSTSRHPSIGTAPISTINHSDPLPDGWDMSTDGQGRTFFIDHKNQTTTWKDPRLSRSTAQPNPSSSPINSSSFTAKQTLSQSTSTPPSNPGGIAIGSPNSRNFMMPNLSASSQTSNQNLPNSGISFGSPPQAQGNWPGMMVINPQAGNFSSPGIPIVQAPAASMNPKSPNVGMGVPPHMIIPPTVPQFAISPPSIANPNQYNLIPNYQQQQQNLPKPQVNSSASHPSSHNQRSSISTLEVRIPKNAAGNLSERAAVWRSTATVCTQCQQSFGMFKRNHPCACCNFAYCSSCATKKAEVSGISNQSDKVCDGCFDHIQKKDKKCLRRILPYLKADDPDLLEALVELPDLMTAEANFGSLSSLKIHESIILLLQSEIDDSKALLSIYQVVTLLASLSLIPVTDEFLRTLKRCFVNHLSNSKYHLAVKTSIVQCIATLASEDVYLPYFNDGNFHEHLLPLLGSTDVELQMETSVALLAFINSGSARIKVDDTEKFTSALASASSGMLASDPQIAAKNSEFLKILLSILSKLTASERSFQEAVYVNGGVQLLLETSQLHSSIQIQSAIFEVLANLSKIPETILALMHSNGLSTLLDLIGNFSVGGGFDGAGGVLKQNVSAPSQKSANSQPMAPSKDQQKQVKSLMKKLLTLLLKLAHESDNNFEDRAKVVQVVTQKHVLSKLSSLLPSETIGKVQKVVAELLIISIVNEDGRTAASETGVLMNLVSLISISMAHSSSRQGDRTLDKSSSRLPKMVELVGCLCKGHEINASQIVDCGVLALLLDTLNPSSTSALTIEISKLLLVLSSSPSSHSFIASFLQKLTQLVSNPLQEVVEASLATLANLTASPESRSLVFNDTTVHVVLPLMSSPKYGIQLQAAKFLNGISQDPRASSDMFSSVLKPLVIQLSSQMAHVRNAALKTLLDLIRNSPPSSSHPMDPGQQMRIQLAKSDGAISSIVSILSSTQKIPTNQQDGDLKFAAIELICHVSFTSPGRSVVLQTPNAVNLVVQGLLSQEDAMVLWSVNTLSNVLKTGDANLAEALRSNGIIQVISKLLSSNQNFNTSTNPNNNQTQSNQNQIFIACITAISQLFQFQSCRIMLMEEGLIIKKLLLVLSEGLRTIQNDQLVDPQVKLKMMTSINAMQQLVQSGNEASQTLGKDSQALKTLTDSIVVLTPKVKTSNNNSNVTLGNGNVVGNNKNGSGIVDSEMSDQLVYLSLLICSTNQNNPAISSNSSNNSVNNPQSSSSSVDTWPSFVRTGGLAFLLALAVSSNQRAQLLSLTELAKLSLDVSFRKIIFEGDGLETALFAMSTIHDMKSVVQSSSTGNPTDTIVLSPSFNSNGNSLGNVGSGGLANGSNPPSIPNNASAASPSHSLPGLILEKCLEVVTNICEDAPSLASFLNLSGVQRLNSLLQSFVDASSSPSQGSSYPQTKTLISIAYNMVRIILQVLMFHKPPNPETSWSKILPCLLTFLKVDISNASYQSLQLTKIVSDTLVKLMENQNSNLTFQLYNLGAHQVFLHLLVRYRPSLQSPNIAEVSINALNKLIGSGNSSSNSDGISNSISGLQIAPTDLESLFSYLNHPVVLHIVSSLASDKTFKSSLDKKSLDTLLPHLHLLLDNSNNTSNASSSSFKHNSNDLLIDPIAFITALFQQKQNLAPSFALLDAQGLVGLAHGLVKYLDPMNTSSSSLALNPENTRLFLNGFSLLSHMSKHPSIHRPFVSSSQRSALGVSSGGIRSSSNEVKRGELLSSLSNLVNQNNSILPRPAVSTEPPRFELLKLVFNAARIYNPNLKHQLSPEAFDQNNSNSSASASNNTANAIDSLSSTSPSSTTNNSPLSRDSLSSVLANQASKPTTPSSQSQTSTSGLSPTSSFTFSSSLIPTTLPMEDPFTVPSSSNANDLLIAIPSSSTTSITVVTKSNNSQQSAQSSHLLPPDLPTLSLAPIEMLTLNEHLLVLLSSLSKSSSIHPLLFESKILLLVSQCLRDYLKIEEENSSTTSDLSLAAKHDIIQRQVPHALAILNNVAGSNILPSSSSSSTSSIISFTKDGKLITDLFQILSLGVSNQTIIGILEFLRVVTIHEDLAFEVKDADGLMSLIGLLSNEQNHVTSLSLSILCNLAQFDELQIVLASYIDISLMNELSGRLGDSELAFGVQKLKDFLGYEN